MIYKVSQSSTTTRMFEIEIMKMVGEHMPKDLANIVGEMLAPPDLKTLDGWIHYHHELCEIFNGERAFVDNLRLKHSDASLAPLEKYLKKSRKYTKNLAKTFKLMGMYADVSEMSGDGRVRRMKEILTKTHISVTLNNKKRLPVRGDEPLSKETKNDITWMLEGNRVELINMSVAIAKTCALEKLPFAISSGSILNWIAAIELAM
jgi:hypothetical protein